MFRIRVGLWGQWRPLRTRQRAGAGRVDERRLLAVGPPFLGLDPGLQPPPPRRCCGYCCRRQRLLWPPSAGAGTACAGCTCCSCGGGAGGPGTRCSPGRAATVSGAQGPRGERLFQLRPSEAVAMPDPSPSAPRLAVALLTVKKGCNNGH